MAFDPTAAANARRQAQQDQQRKAHEQTIEYAQNLGTDIVIKVQDMIDRLDPSKPSFDADAMLLTERFMGALQALNATPSSAPAAPVVKPQPAQPVGGASVMPAPVAPAPEPEPVAPDAADAEPADEPEDNAAGKHKGGFIARALAKAKEIDQNSKVK